MTGDKFMLYVTTYYICNLKLSTKRHKLISQILHEFYKAKQFYKWFAIINRWLD